MHQQHNQQGFIILSMFMILTLCATLVSLFMIRGTIYGYSMRYFVSDKKNSLQLQSGLALAQKLITPSSNSSSQQSSAQQTTAGVSSSTDDPKAQLEQLLKNREKKITAEMLGETGDVDLLLSVVAESGKININSLYDFTNKKFVNQGSTTGDRQKLCQWLFDRIAQVRGGQSLFEPFAEFLKKRTAALNDVTELLAIPEFSEYFYQSVFYRSQLETEKKQPLYLADLFTVVTEDATIQPWLLSPSLIVVLGGKSASLGEKKIQEALKQFAATADWSTQWNETIGVLYGIKFDNLSEEMKSMLTPQFEATIFSVSLHIDSQKNAAGLCALIKKKTETNGLSTYDIARMYQT
jgi:hypothetical protein